RRFVGEIAALLVHGYRRRSQSSSELVNCLRLLGRTSLRVAFRARRAVRSSQELPCFFCDPDWSHQQINWSLKKRRMVSLNFVTHKKKNPAAHEKTRSPNPFHED